MLEMKNIAIVSPAFSVKGGISTLINSVFGSDAFTEYKFYRVSSHMDGPGWIKLCIAVYGLLRMFLLLSVQDISIVYIHSGDSPSPLRKYFYYKLSKKFKCKVILHWHGASFMEQYRRLSHFWKKKIKELLSHSDMVICLSSSWKNAVLTMAPDANTFVLPNAVKIPGLAIKNRHPENAVNMTFLGQIGSRKGIWDLLQVVKKLIEHEYAIHLFIAGNGEIEKLKEEVTRLGIRNNVNVLGWISGKERDALLRKTDIYVLPSYGEGMPMSILEAMSYAVPVVATRVGGIPEIVKDNKTGFLIDPGDRESLYNKLEILISSREHRERIGRQARSFVASNNNLDVYFKTLNDIFDSF
jgi:glycosyltransferase involved in cell wall biosynthesis